MPAYALTIFIGAFLLFQVQPLIGKYILPWFGGGPGVWTTCMLFFQVLLVGGYAYAHLISHRLNTRRQVIVHLSLLAVALALLPIIPADSWKPNGSGDPTLQILALLSVSLGLPYLALSATGPLMQQWFSRTYPGVSPYRLYALSNLGSLLALVSYPFYFEPHFTRKTQAGIWTVGLVVFVVCSGWCAKKLWKLSAAGNSIAPQEDSIQTDSTPPKIIRRLLWLLLPACASVLLLATTNKICQDMAVIPFLWVVPLGLYLLSFIICFDNPRWYSRSFFLLALVAALTGVCWALYQVVELSLGLQIAIYCGAMFICCMFCHGELYRLRPNPRHLTTFYLMLATGGALGGLFVAVVGPLIFTDYFELHWGLFLCGLLCLLICIRNQDFLSARQWRWLACVLTLAACAVLDWSFTWLDNYYRMIPGADFKWVRIGMRILFVLLVATWIIRKRFKTFSHWRFVACTWLTLAVLGLGLALWTHAQSCNNESVYTSRNFYGVLRILERNRGEPQTHHFLLRHGRIIHGLQFVDPQRALQPAAYYTKRSGVGLALSALTAEHRRIGLVGLGTGVLAAYGQPGDTLRIYEINPKVKQIASTAFTYLAHCRSKVEIVLGDARLSLEREPRQHFDLLVLDAFSSDAIPVHLLTREAFEVYGRHLNPDGIIAVHISNHYLDLTPVLINVAGEFHYNLAWIEYEETDEKWWAYGCTWVLLTHNQAALDTPAIREATSEVPTHSINVPLWTDDFASVFHILR